MRNKCEQPLMRGTHLPMILLGVVMVGYGLLIALVGSWYSNQAMRGLISTSVYRARLAAFEQTTGFIAGILLLVFFILSAIRSSRITRVAFAIGALASTGPMMTGIAEYMLFTVIGLPTMNAGSVLAGAVATLFFALPMTILFLLLACGRCITRKCRWLSLASMLVVLATTFFPIYVTLLAFLFKPGDPAVGRMMEMSSQVIKLRFILPGLSLLWLSYLSERLVLQQPKEISAENVGEKGDVK